MTRSRSIVLLILLLTITAAAFAQSSTTVAAASTEPIHFGVKAGANAFKLSGQSFDNKTYFGFSAGVYADIGIHGRWGLQPELLYNGYSEKTTDFFNNNFNGATSNVNLNYVTLPILVTFQATDAFTILVGPQYGYLVNQTSGLTPQSKKDAFTKNDFSILFGGQLKAGRMGLGLRYVIGFTQLNNLDDNIDSWKNQGFQFYLTYRIK
jgi:hypothetical protein